MKRKVLSLVVPALLVAGAANAAEIYNKDGNKLDLYGKVDGLHYFSDDEGSDGDQTYVRFGFKGETQVNDQITGFGQWEYNVQANEAEGASDQAWTRLAFAGVRFGEAGAFDYGRNYGVIYDVTSWTDVLPEFGGDTYGADNFMQSRANGVATYRNTDFFGLVDGLNFALQYQGKNGSSRGESDNGGRNTLKQNGDGYGMSLTYDLGEGFSVGGAMSSSKRTADQNVADAYGNGDRADVYSAGLKYDANNIYLAAQFSQTYNATRFGTSNGSGRTDAWGFADKAQNFEAVAQYQFDFGLRPSIAYLQSRGKDISSVNGRDFGDQDLLKYVDVGTTYYFNKNLSTYVDYKINLLDDNTFTRQAGVSTDDIVALGVVYQF